MKTFLNQIRMPDNTIQVKKQILYSSCVLIFGIVLGLISKILDCTPVNELPYYIQRLDLGNFFSRLAIWLLLAVCISVYSRTPIRAGINTFLFFSGMLTSYYLYTKFVAGFFPRSYVLIWVGLTLVSPFLAFICWYAKGKGKIAFLISAGIIGVLFSQAFYVGLFYAGMRYPLEVVVWLMGIVVLYRSPKQAAAMTGAGILLALVIVLIRV